MMEVSPPELYAERPRAEPAQQETRLITILVADFTNAFFSEIVRGSTAAPRR